MVASIVGHMTLLTLDFRNSLLVDEMLILLFNVWNNVLLLVWKPSSECEECAIINRQGVLVYNGSWESRNQGAC